MIPAAFVEALQQGLFFSLCLGLGCSCLWGFWLILRPESALRFATDADRWVTTEGTFARLNQSVSTHRFFYRHHRLAGVLICLGSLYALVRWAFAYDQAATAEALFQRGIHSDYLWLLQAGELIFVSFNVVFLLFAFVIIIRPSLLKVPETLANRWVEVPADQVLDQKFDPLQAVMERRPRSVGLAISLVCSGLLLFLLILT